MLPKKKREMYFESLAGRWAHEHNSAGQGAITWAIMPMFSQRQEGSCYFMLTQPRTKFGNDVALRKTKAGRVLDQTQQSRWRLVLNSCVQLQKDINGFRKIICPYWLGKRKGASKACRLVFLKEQNIEKLKQLVLISWNMYWVLLSSWRSADNSVDTCTV